MDGEWKAFVQEPDYADSLMQNVRLHLRYKTADHVAYVVETTLTLKTATEGMMIEPSGILLPRPALEAIRDGIEKMNGRPESNPEAENRVLREWLAREQGIVDAHALRSSRTAR